MVTKTCLPYMKEGSEIILIGSGSGYAPNPNQLVYSATKAFVIHFSVGLREELKKRGINVMVVNPGRMKTGMEHMPGNGTNYAGNAIREHYTGSWERICQT